MSNQDSSDRTQPPTPRRREQFRREGKVARSADLTGGVVMIGCLGLLSVVGAGLASLIESMFKSSFTLTNEPLATSSLFQSAASSTLSALAPILIGVFVLAIGAVLVQIGRPILFHRSERRFGLTRTPHPWVGFWAGAAKIIVIAFVTYELIARRLPQLISMEHPEVRQFFAFACQTLISIALRIAFVLLAFGIIDYLIQRYRLETQLKMTRREVQEELRQTEGDPKLKARRRQLRLSPSPRTRGEGRGEGPAPIPRNQSVNV